MKEFGSDYHFLKNPLKCESTIFEKIPNAIYLADGRQGIELLVNHYRWKRIWFPEYFCWEIIEYIRQRCKIEILTYEDNPLNAEDNVIEKLAFERDDVLLKMNYFGLRRYKYDVDISIPVIEDHSHNIFNEWIQKSKADFCIASLRKTLPVAGGGIVWSNIHSLSELAIGVKDDPKNEQLSQIRWEAMKEKAYYLSLDNSSSIQKDSFRNKYIQTEQMFDDLPVCSISDADKSFLEKFDISNWYSSKIENWKCLVQKLSPVMKKKRICILTPKTDDSVIFSLILLFPSCDKRDKLKKSLIEQSIYPAILWDVPDRCSPVSKRFSGEMLSIHCDGRYSSEEIDEMGDIIYNLFISI